MLTLPTMVERQLKRCKKKKYDLVLMDFMMPEVGGIEATARICNGTEVPFENVPIVIGLTADVLSISDSDCFQSGMKAVLTKPIDKEQLRDMLRDRLQV